jgi:hypothetical protein
MRQFDFSFKETREDFGGELTVTANTPEAKERVIRHFRLFEEDILGGAKAITSEAPLVHTIDNGSMDNPAMFETHGSLALEFTAPYLKVMGERMGYTGRGILPDIPVEGLTHWYPWGGLCHTHYLRDVWLEGGHLCYVCYTTGSEWNKKVPAVYAEEKAEDYMQESIGTRYHEPEFQQLKNGLFRENPKYLRRNRVTPAFSGEWLWEALCERWLVHEATDAQRDLVEEDRSLMYRNHRGKGSLREVRNYPRGLRRSWEGSEIAWEEFQNLGNEDHGTQN